MRKKEIIEELKAKSKKIKVHVDEEHRSKKSVKSKIKSLMRMLLLMDIKKRKAKKTCEEFSINLDKEGDLIERLHPRKLTHIEVKNLRKMYQKTPQRRFEEEEEVEFILDVIKDTPFLIQFSQEEKIEVLRNSQLVLKKRGQVIFEQGDKSDSMYIIILGSVNVLVKYVNPNSLAVEYKVSL